MNLGSGRRPADLTGPYFLRYSLADGTRPWEHVGDDPDEAIGARERKQAYFDAIDSNVPLVQDHDAVKSRLRLPQIAQARAALKRPGT